MDDDSRGGRPERSRIIVYSLRSVYGSVLAFVHAEKYWNRQLTYPFHGVIWTFGRMLHHQVLGNPAHNSN